MIFGQIEKEGLELDMGIYRCPDYWDAVYLAEEDNWELGKEIQNETFDPGSVMAAATKPEPNFLLKALWSAAFNKKFTAI